MIHHKDVRFRGSILRIQKSHDSKILKSGKIQFVLPRSRASDYLNSLDYRKFPILKLWKRINSRINAEKEPEDGFMVMVILFHICSFVIIHE